MILLTSTSDLVQVVTTTTAPVDVQASYVDNNAGSITPGRLNTGISSATTTTIVGSPGSGVQRNVKAIHIFNRDASNSNVVTVKHTDGTTADQLFKVTLSAGESLIYTDNSGWTYYAADGTPKTGQLAVGSTSANSASPTGNVSTTEKAMGLGSSFTYTPVKSGNLLVWIGGVALNATAAGDGTNVTGRFGTGTAPINGATTGLGTQIGLPQHFIASTTAGQQGFIVMGKITGQAIGTALWFDLSLLAVTGGGSTVKDVQIIVVEVP